MKYFLCKLSILGYSYIHTYKHCILIINVTYEYVLIISFGHQWWTIVSPTQGLPLHPSCSESVIEGQIALELSIKSLKEGSNRGFDPSLRKLFIKSFLARCMLEPILKIGANFDPSSSHLSNFEIILGSKIRHVHGTCHPRSPLPNARLPWPTHYSRTS